MKCKHDWYLSFGPMWICRKCSAMLKRDPNPKRITREDLHKLDNVCYSFNSVGVLKKVNNGFCLCGFDGFEYEIETDPGDIKPGGTIQIYITYGNCKNNKINSIHDFYKRINQ